MFADIQKKIEVFAVLQASLYKIKVWNYNFTISLITSSIKIISDLRLNDMVLDKKKLSGKTQNPFKKKWMRCGIKSLY